jgi:hypothetical protein
MSEQEGRQSPPPSRQTGAQMHDTPASGQGIDKADNKEKTNEDALKVGSHPDDIHITELTMASQNLTSNPKGPLDDHAKEKVSKAVP